jgi:hypothetical protein
VLEAIGAERNRAVGLVRIAGWQIGDVREVVATGFCDVGEESHPDIFRPRFNGFAIIVSGLRKAERYHSPVVGASVSLGLDENKPGLEEEDNVGSHGGTDGGVWER